MQSSELPVIGIVGPTAIGKTGVAIEIAKWLGGRAEILSADSVQVYKRLDIGSAKPDADEQSLATFRLIDLVEPDQDFTLSDFQQAAVDAYKRAVENGYVPILAGGTGLYVRSLTLPLGLPHVPPDEQFREMLREYAAENGSNALHRKLSEADPETALRLHPNDTKRIIRALEVLEHTGKRLSDWHREDQATNPSLIPRVKLFGLNVQRDKLNVRINSRVDSMMDSGFSDEVKNLLSSGFARTLKSMQSLGYKELCAFHVGEIALDDAVERIKLRTRQFARRQLIWFRGDDRINWLDVEGRNAAQIAEEIMSRYSESMESTGR